MREWTASDERCVASSARGILRYTTSTLVVRRRGPSSEVAAGHGRRLARTSTRGRPRAHRDLLRGFARASFTRCIRGPTLASQPTSRDRSPTRAALPRADGHTSLSGRHRTRRDAIGRVDLGRASHEAADAIRGAVHLAAEAARAAAMAAGCARVK